MSKTASIPYFTSERLAARFKRLSATNKRRIKMIAKGDAERHSTPYDISNHLYAVMPKHFKLAGLKP